MNGVQCADDRFRLTFPKVAFLVGFWLLLFIEPVQVGPLKVSQIWKAVVLVALFVFLIRRSVPVFVFIGLLFALKYLLYAEMPYGYLQAVQDSLEALVLPIFIWLFVYKFKSDRRAVGKLVDISILVSIFILYSSVPFLLGLKSLNREFDLSSYGVEAQAVNGIFYHIANASKLFTMATVVLLITRKRFETVLLMRIFWLASVILGVYLIYASWTRTAWFMFAASLLIVLFYGANFKRKLAGVMAALVFVSSVLFVYQTDQAFRWRLSGGAVYRQDAELSLASLTQARVPFIFVAFSNLRDEGLMAQVIGYGTERATDLFYQKTGMAIVSHNRTTEILEASGALGLLLYWAFLAVLAKRVIRSWPTASMEVRRLTVASTFLFSGYYLTSHGTPLMGEVILAAIIVAVWLGGRSPQLAVQKG